MAIPPPEHVHDLLWGSKTAFSTFLRDFGTSFDTVLADNSEPRWLAMGHFNFMAWLGQNIANGVQDNRTRDLLFGLLRQVYSSGCLGWLSINTGYLMETRSIGRSLLEFSWLFEVGCEDPQYLQNWWHQQHLPTGARLQGLLKKFDRKRFGMAQGSSLSEGRDELYRSWSTGTHPTFLALIVPWEYNEGTGKSFMRFGPVLDDFAVRRAEEHYLMLVCAVASICAIRAVECFPDLPDHDELVPAVGMLESAFRRYSERIRSELKAPLTLSPAQVSEHLKIWSMKKDDIDEKDS